MKFISILFIIFAWDCRAAELWTKRQRDQYLKRHFIELEQSLASQGRAKAAQLIADQAADLSGCREVNGGHGSLQAVVACMRFFNREDVLGLRSPKRDELIKDLNLICGTRVHDSQDLRRLLNAQVVHESLFWRSCSNAAWEQVYLTVYANFDADPAAGLALVRHADGGLLPNKPFQRKISLFLKHF